MSSFSFVGKGSFPVVNPDLQISWEVGGGHPSPKIRGYPLYRILKITVYMMLSFSNTNTCDEK